MIKIVVLKVTDRVKEAGLAQKVLTAHSSLIATRLGFHELTDEICSREACMVLHLTGDPAEWVGLINELSSVGGLQIIETEMSDHSEMIISPNSTWDFTVLAMLIDQSGTSGRDVQKILTSYGCEIRSRMGLNETVSGKPFGMIILEMRPTKEGPESLLRKLSEIEGVSVKLIRL